jgi:uncharacterized protein YqfA (UPF0365 family)
MSIIEHDFGFASRGQARRLRILLKQSALHEANIRANPLPYLERASEHIYQLEKILFEAVEAAAEPKTAAAPEMISVSRDEYRRLLVCRAIVKSGFEQLVSGSCEEADVP